MDEALVGWKKHFAAVLGVGRTSYYIPATKQKQRDEVATRKLRAAHTKHPAYGYRRLALELGWGAHKTRRIMKLSKIKVLGVKKKLPFVQRTNTDNEAPAAARVYRNVIKEDGLVAQYPCHLWAEDFTYLWFYGKWYYLATIIDLYSRQIVGWTISEHHDTKLITAALTHALAKHKPPRILHQDRGSEYCSSPYGILTTSLGIELSFSEKGSPWENGFQESFYRCFKLELDASHLNRFNDVGELVEAIAHQLHYYNAERIHSVLGTSPQTYAAGHKANEHQQGQYRSWHLVNFSPKRMLTALRDKVFGILGA